MQMISTWRGFTIFQRDPEITHHALLMNTIHIPHVDSSLVFILILIIVRIIYFF